MTPKCNNGDKNAYPSMKRAKQVRETLSKKLNTKDLRIYQCPHCHKWHFTSEGWIG